MGKAKTRTKRAKIKCTRYVGGTRRSVMVPIGITTQSRTLFETPTLSSMIEPGQESEKSPLDESVASTSKYYCGKQVEVENWVKSRIKLHAAARKAEVPIFSCTICNRYDSEICRCRDCGPSFIACKDCMLKEHEQRPLHSIESWKDGMYQAISMPKKMLLHHCDCIKVNLLVTVVNNSGMLHEVIFGSCNCYSASEIMAKFMIWPNKPEKPTWGFEFGFLTLYRAFLLEGHVSAKAFVNSFCLKNELNKKQARALYTALMGEALEEFKHLCRCNEDIVTSGVKCAACPNDEIIISMDANFGLVHKKNSGKSFETGKHPNQLFLADEDVNKYLLTHPNGTKDTQKDTDCSNFQAGSALRSKIKNKRLDVTGIFAAICKHEVPICVLNMSMGERLAYPCFIIEKMLQSYPSLCVMYDIACVLEKYLKKLPQGEEVLSRLKLAIPAFHAYGHQAKCQIKYSPKRNPKFGLTDGEGTERIWSYLRPFSKITKEMTPSHREDLLTDAMLHYGSKKHAMLSKSLVEKYEKAEHCMVFCHEEKLKIVELHAVLVTEENLLSWQEEEKELILEKSKNARPTWQENYVSLLMQYDQLHNLIIGTDVDIDVGKVAEEREAKQKLQNIEQRHRISRWQANEDQYKETLRLIKEKKACAVKKRMLLQARERKFLCSLVKKYSDGQAVATKISKQITASTSKIKKMKVLLDDVTDSVSIISECLNPDSELFCDFPVAAEAIPSSIKKKLVDIHLQVKCAEEEKLTVQQEMCQLMDHTVHHHMQLVAKLDEVSTEERPLFLKKISNLESYYIESSLQFSKYILDIPQMDMMNGRNINERAVSEIDENDTDDEEIDDEYDLNSLEDILSNPENCLDELLSNVDSGFQSF